MGTKDLETPAVSRKLDESGAMGLMGKIMVAGIIVLFMVVVFVLLLHLYAKWFWWHRSLSPEDRRRRSRRRRFVFAPGQDDPAAAAAAAGLRGGLDPAVLRSLPVLIFDSSSASFSSGDGLECAVCLCEISQGEKARLLPKCNHGFHLDCIDMWFQSHSTCPLCRNPVAAISDPSSPKSSSPNPQLEQQQQSHQSPDRQSLALGVYSAESPNFPTNVLFWGDQTQVTSLSSPPPELSSSSAAAAAASSTATNSSSTSSHALVIDIPSNWQMTEAVLSPSPLAMRRRSEEEVRSPMTGRLRSFKRLLSRDKKAIACSPTPTSSCSADDAEEGKGQVGSSKVASDG